MAEYRVDADVADALREVRDYLDHAPLVARDDWQALRRGVNEEYAAIRAASPPLPSEVVREDLVISGFGDVDLHARWYSRGTDRPGAAVVYAHGGGMVGGSIEDYDYLVSTYVGRTGVPFLSVAYRLAPENYDEHPAQDIVSALRWLAAHADIRGVDPARLAVMGDSAGGGIAASAAILARDEDVPISHQLLVYPMLDHRIDSTSPAVKPFLVWTPDMNAAGWAARKKHEITPVTSPARLTSFHGLPSTYIEVGDLDLFRNESIAYAARLAAADVPLELHVHPAVPHGYDFMNLNAKVTVRALHDRVRVIRSL